jgi:DNA helicase IV
VGLFLPSLHGTKIHFIRAILSDKKQALKQAEVRHFVVPKYEELSVKNLYEDALKDAQVGPYLPDLEMNSNRLPERDFFFGVLGTIKPDYLH